MRLHYVLTFLLLSLTVLTNCGEDIEEPEEPVDLIDSGDVHGVVTDKETGDPVEGASVKVNGEVALTSADGKYSLQEIPFSDRIEVVVTAANYMEYSSTLSLDQQLMIFNIVLVPTDSPSAQILVVLEALSRDIEALDPNRIPSIQSHLAEDYVAASDPVNDQPTIFGVVAGVVPPDYAGLPDTILNIVAKYDKLEFKFADPEVEFKGDSAEVLMRFEVYAETKPKPPDPAKKWEIVIDGRLDLRKENGDWKITYWRLIEPFKKFQEEPLE